MGLEDWNVNSKGGMDEIVILESYFDRSCFDNSIGKKVINLMVYVLVVSFLCSLNLISFLILRIKTTLSKINV